MRHTRHRPSSHLFHKPFSFVVVVISTDEKDVLGPSPILVQSFVLALFKIHANMVLVISSTQKVVHAVLGTVTATLFNASLLTTARVRGQDIHDNVH